MAKAKTVYFCQSCGMESAKWMGQCSSCGEWNTFAEEEVPTGKGSRSASRRQIQSKVTKLNEIEAAEEERIFTGIAELDRVLGGGIVPGSMTLVGGDPGIGKSTLDRKSVV